MVSRPEPVEHGRDENLVRLAFAKQYMAKRLPGTNLLMLMAGSIMSIVGQASFDDHGLQR